LSVNNLISPNEVVKFAETTTVQLVAPRARYSKVTITALNDNHYPLYLGLGPIQYGQGMVLPPGSSQDFHNIHPSQLFVAGMAGDGFMYMIQEVAS